MPDLEKELNELKARVAAIDAERANRWMDKGATWLSRRVGPLSWLGALFQRLPLWPQLILVLVVVVGIPLGLWLGWGAFVDWAGARKYQSETSKLQAELSGVKDRATKAEAEYQALKAGYDALKLDAERLQAEVVAQSGRVVQQQKRTATATIAYSNALKTPVAAIEIDASSDKALEASLQRLTDAAREAMRKAGQ